MNRKLSAVDLKARLYRRRYVLPNLVTLGSMFCGFLAIIYSTSGRYEKAVISIGLSILLDGLDGRVARRFNATSKFGGEFDSFADFVSFGVAPAILMYNWAFRQLADEWGVFVSFMFALGSATRLARFNLSTENLKGFMGLPTPAAAGMIASVVHFAPPVEIGRATLTFYSTLLLVVAFLMVSKFEYISLKKVRLEHLPLPIFVAMGAFVALIWYRNELGFLLLASTYVLSGPLLWLINFRSRKEKERWESTPAPAERDQGDSAAEG